MAGKDMHSMMGGQYPAPGITLGPALTFGWPARGTICTLNLHSIIETTHENLFFPDLSLCPQMPGGSP